MKNTNYTLQIWKNYKIGRITKRNSSNFVKKPKKKYNYTI